MTFDGTSFRLYKNGAQVGNTTAGTATSGTYTLYMGGNQGSSSCFNGTIDDAAYFASALSTTLMAKIYTNYLPFAESFNYSGNRFTYTTTKANNSGGMTHDVARTGLTYTWSAINPPASVSFSQNGTYNARNSTATFITTRRLQPAMRPYRHGQRPGPYGHTAH